jgi:CubicO group peptidase (beta-lactamase class C family)
VRKWIPELPDYGRQIRVRDLLHHTSGLRDFEATMRDFLGLMAGQRELNFAGAGQLSGLIVSTAPGSDSVQNLRFVRLASR